MWRSSAVWLLAVIVLGGCGGSSGHDEAGETLTVPAYNGYPAITVPVTQGTPAFCRREARVFTRAAASYLAPFPSDADTHLVLARLMFIEFKAHRCDMGILSSTLSRRLNAKQRRVVVADFHFLGDAGRELTGV